jgi:hypothetical protein
MLVALTARKLKPGALEEFLRVWGDEEPLARAIAELPADAPARRWQKAYTVRNVEDGDEVVSFGFFDGTLDELRASQRELGYAEERGKTDALVAEVTVDGLFEVVSQEDIQALTERMSAGTP